MHKINHPKNALITEKTAFFYGFLSNCYERNKLLQKKVLRYKV